MNRPTPIEALESRIAPAAIVTVEYTNGVLKLTGDDGGANVTLTALDATHYLLTPGLDTSFTMGSDTDLARVPVTGPIKGINATFGAGDDTFSVIGADLKGDIAVDLGAGTANSVVFSSITAGSLSVKGGAGDDSVNVAGWGAAVKGAATFDLGEGANTLTVAATNFLVGQDLSFTAGAGDDSVTLASYVKVKGSATFELGAGDSNVAVLGASFSVGKKLLINAPTLAAGADPGTDPAETASIFMLAPVLYVGGDLEITTGAGQDNLTNVTLGGKSSLRGNVSISTGDGDDSVAWVLYGGTSKSVTIDGGNGSNTTIFGIAGAGVGAVKFLGGTGSDNVISFLVGGKVGTMEYELGDADAGANSAAAILVSSSAKTIDFTGGVDPDSFFAAGIHSKIPGGVTADAKEGPATLGAFGFGGSVGAVDLLSQAASGELVSVIVGGAQTTFGSLKIETGDGDTDIELQPDVSSIPFGGIPGLPGFPIPTLGGLIQGWTVKGATTITSGTGNDQVHFAGIGVNLAGGLSLALGEGDDALTGVVDSVSIGKLEFFGGAGDDLIDISGQASLGAAVINMGEGTGLVHFEGHDRALKIGSLDYTSSALAGETDTLVLARVQVLGKLDATFGAGESSFQADDSTFGKTVNVATGAGNDSVLLDTLMTTGYGTIFSKAVTIDLGADDDTLTIGGDPLDRFILTKNKFSADGGTGTNTLNVTAADNILAKPLSTTNFA